MDSTVDVFLCHTGADKAWTRALGERLEAETIDGTPAGRRIRVFFDEWDIVKGTNIVSRLGSALSKAWFVATVLSPEFFESGWTELEWTDVVANDPANREGRLLPLRRRDVSLDGLRRMAFPPPFNALNYFDFRDDKDFESRLTELLTRVRNEPPARGTMPYARYSSRTIGPLADSHAIQTPDEVDEVLISNLAPLVEYPTAVHHASTQFRSIKDLPAQMDVGPWTFRFWNEKLLTFADLQDPECSLNRLIDPYAVDSWSSENCLKDAELRNQWLALTNRVVSRHLWSRGVAQDAKRRFLFRPGDNGGNRVVTLPGQRPKEVAAKKKHHTTGQEFWVHYSASIRVVLIGSTPFLRILPSYAFTSDGITPLENKLAGRFKVIWGGKQDSAAVLRLTLFWLLLMSDGHEVATLDSGGDPFQANVLPATSRTKLGIKGDHIRIKALLEQAPEAELDLVAAAAALDADGEVESEESSTDD